MEKESICSAAWCNLPDKSNATLVSALRPELEPLQGMVNKSIHRFLIHGTEASQVEWIDDEAKSEEPEALQEKLNPRAWCNLQDKSNDTIDSAFKPELGPLQDKVSESIDRFWIPGKQASQVEWLDEEAKSEEPEASQGKLNSRAWCNLQYKSSATLDSAVRPELEPLRDKASDSIHRFWTPETGASQSNNELQLLDGRQEAKS